MVLPSSCCSCLMPASLNWEREGKKDDDDLKSSRQTRAAALQTMLSFNAGAVRVGWTTRCHHGPIVVICFLLGFESEVTNTLGLRFRV